MVEYVFIGRRRSLVRIAIYALLTVGIYGRVLLYKQVKEIDGHRALFLNLRAFGLLLSLPFFGPLAVKYRLRRLLGETVQGDVTHPPIPRRTLGALAWLPLVPGFHLLSQHHLNSYWRRQQRIMDASHRRAQIEKLSKQRRSASVQIEIKALEEELAIIEKGLRDEEDAANALREIHEEERRLRSELHEETRLHRRQRRRAALRRLWPFRRRARPTRRSRGEDSPPEPVAAADEAPEGPRRRRSLFGFFRRKKGGKKRRGRKRARRDAPSEDA